uniref:Uncharacterized protein n=1 Tax=Ditylenchus dipsaci TaxID=166011 RepID=A0A915E2E6_9BILA
MRQKLHALTGANAVHAATLNKTATTSSRTSLALVLEVWHNWLRQPWFYMTEDVIEATTMCLVAQAQEYEESQTEEELEISVLREFGRCLEQIIENANSCQTNVR